MINFIRSIGLKVWGYMAGFVVVLLLLKSVYDAGGNATEVDGLKKTVHALKERDDNEITIDALDNKSVNSSLRDNGWLRD